MATSLSILGFGAFGRFMAGHLRDRFDVRVFDREDVSGAAREAGVRAVGLAEAARSNIIVLAVPVQNLETLLVELRGLLVRAGAGEGTLVVDVSSVKSRPVELMTAHLPDTVGIIGTHPLFGPQSGRDGIAGLPVALCPVRAGAAQVECVREFLGRTLGLRVVDVSPEEHDRQMAYVQALTHLMSRALGEMGLPETPLATIAYERLLGMRANLEHDSWELFLTIERENPFAADVRRRPRETLDRIEDRLDRD